MSRHLVYLLLVLFAVSAARAPLAQQRSPDADAGAAEQDDEPEKHRIYKFRDAQGRTIFTDEPPEGQASEEVELKSGNDLPLKPTRTPSPVLEDEQEDDEAAEYQVRITSPEEEATLRHPTEPVPVQVSVDPQLASGHSLRILHNGEPLEGQALDWPDRGTHTLKAQVVDQAGEVISESATRTIFVHRPSVNQPSRQ